MIEFSGGLLLLSAGTLIYEITVTRLLSVMTWYYLGFVSVSMGMLGMTAGALLVQLRPHWFTPDQISKRLQQAAVAMAVSLPFALLTMQAIPVDTVPTRQEILIPNFRLQSFYNLLLFDTALAAPFFFSGIAICLALTRSAYSIGKVYFVDLLGAAAGSIGAVIVLDLIDPSSAVFAISAMAFFAAAIWSKSANDAPLTARLTRCGAVMAVVTALNAAAPFGVRPVFCKGRVDIPKELIAEVWNPISRIRATAPPGVAATFAMWGPSSEVPNRNISDIAIDIDSMALTLMYRYTGADKDIDFLAYDVTAMAPRLRAGGSAAIIGVGGGRDALTAHLFKFNRIVGIELNSGIVDLVMHRFRDFGNLDKVPGFEMHSDEGRSYFARTTEKFDVIQASMVDTWAATVAGAMTLSENALYTVEGWRVFYQHLKPGGLLTFTRWDAPEQRVQTTRMFALGWATLLSEGVSNPGANIALIRGGPVATILVSNAPLSAADLKEIHTVATALHFEILYLPDVAPHDPDLLQITSTHTISELRKVGSEDQDFSPVFDSAPFFFNTLRLGGSGLRGIVSAIVNGKWGSGDQRAVLFMLSFLLVAIILLAVTIGIPLTRWAELPARFDHALNGGIAYFVAIGLGFMLAEMAMIQQLSIFLGHPIYSLVITLAGLILATGLGSLASERWTTPSSQSVRVPAIASGAALLAYSAVVLPLIHQLAYLPLLLRALACLVLIAPCGLLFGFCFPIGLRWMKMLGREDSLPWMWALNGAASVVASYIAVLISIEASITATAITGAVCYLIAGIALPRNSPVS
ncbi:MAG TPA: hypothetical protein VMU16_05505 [Candidatus Binataceae bacterium]|nr:hypothetical protein [Candidatus Binataceae bacterium]